MSLARVASRCAKATRSRSAARFRRLWRAQSWRSFAASGPGLPAIAVADVTAAIAAVRQGVRDGAVSAAHDISDGGLACALAEMAIAGGVGVQADLDELVEQRGCSGETALFGEAPGGFLLAGGREEIAALADDRGDVFVIGAASGARVSLSAGETEIEVALEEAEGAWNSLAQRVEGVTPAAHQ